MPSHRVQRVAEAIREVVSAAVLFDVADPRVRSVTVLNVEVSGDLRNATINVSVMGTEPEQTLSLRGLRHATSFLRSKVAKRLQMRHTPELVFKLDDSVKKSIAISQLIDEALASDRQGKEEPPTLPAAADADPAPDHAEDSEDDEGDEDFEDDEDEDRKSLPIDIRD